MELRRNGQCGGAQPEKEHQADNETLAETALTVCFHAKPHVQFDRTTICPLRQAPFIGLRSWGMVGFVAGLKGPWSLDISFALAHGRQRRHSYQPGAKSAKPQDRATRVIRAPTARLKRSRDGPRL